MNNNLIIESYNDFNSELFMEIDFFKNCDNKCYKNYLRNFHKQFNKVKLHYPTLEFTIIPSTRPSSIIIRGFLINNETLDDLGLGINLKEYSIGVFVIVPLDFMKNGIRVFDAFDMINFSGVPIEFKHYRPSPNKRRMLCTHKEKDIKSSNAILGVLKSAEHLYLEYRRLQRTGEFLLECHPHN